MGKANTSGGILATAERRAFVFMLRRSGATYRKIAAAAVARFGADALPETWGERYAHKDVTREMQRIREEIGEDVDAILNMELERLDRLTEAMWSRATGGDEAALDRILKIMERRARYLGLDAKHKVDTTGPQKMIVEFVYSDAETEEQVELAS